MQMKTKLIIKNQARELFNEKGFKNVTLRLVAASLQKSYGNITYHYKTKNDLILELYNDMVEETIQILNTFSPENLFVSILEAPKKTFAISMKYLFFFADYIEIRRSYSELFLKVEKDNSLRKRNYLNILKQLQVQNILREDLSENDLNYLMDVSGAVRTFFFINLDPKNFTDSNLEDQYAEYVNKLVFPYLSTNGIKVYQNFTN